MRHLLFVLVFGLAAMCQDTAQQPQLTQVPPKPSCNPNVLFHTTACEDLWNAYNAALQQRQREELQLYINKQKEAATSQATAPLLQRIANQDDQIRRLQNDAPIEKAMAYHNGMGEGGVYGAGGMLLLFGLIFGIRKLAGGYSVTKKSHVASA
jgi:hypothetical protein